MGKFGIVLCVLLSAFGAQAGMLSTVVEIAKSNFVALMDQMEDYQKQLETDAGFSLDNLISSMASELNEWDGKLAQAISVNSDSSSCAYAITKLREARNSTVDSAVKHTQSLIDIFKSDTLKAIEVGDVMMTAAENAEEKFIECLMNVFTSFKCFPEIGPTLITSITSNVITLTKLAAELTANQVTLTADIANFHLSAINNFNSVANDLYEVAQKCAAHSATMG